MGPVSRTEVRGHGIFIMDLEVMVVRGHGKKKYIWKYHENPKKKDQFLFKVDGCLVISNHFLCKVGGPGRGGSVLFLKKCMRKFNFPCYLFVPWRLNSY